VEIQALLEVHNKFGELVAIWNFISPGSSLTLDTFTKLYHIPCTK